MGHWVARGEEENGGGGEGKGEVEVFGSVAGSCGNLSSRRLVICGRAFRALGAQLEQGLGVAIGAGWAGVLTTGGARGGGVWGRQVLGENVSVARGR